MKEPGKICDPQILVTLVVVWTPSKTVLAQEQFSLEMQYERAK